MAKPEHPRRKLVIKIYSPHSEVSCSCGEKRSMVTSSNQPSHKDDSRIVSKVCELKNKKGYYAMAMWVNTEKNPSSSESSYVADTRISRTGKPTWVITENASESSAADSRISLKNKKQDVPVECKKRETKRKVEHIMTMDRGKKMQCWAMLKRLMVGRDAWALKKPLLEPKVLYVLDKSEAMRKPKGLEDIESKLKKWGYSEVDEFVDDVRLVLSYALQYPQRSEVHRTASRISEGFEATWKTVKAKWVHEEREKNKIRKRELHVPKEGEKEVHACKSTFWTSYP